MLVRSLSVAVRGASGEEQKPRIGRAELGTTPVCGFG